MNEIKVKRAYFKQSISLPTGSGVPGGSMSILDTKHPKSVMYWTGQDLRVTWSDGEAIIPGGNIIHMLTEGSDDPSPAKAA